MRNSLYLFLYFSFFFQAEDGIRDGHVTGVQTCALPICSPLSGNIANTFFPLPSSFATFSAAAIAAPAEIPPRIPSFFAVFLEASNASSLRSEERRVGKEFRGLTCTQ